MKGSSQVPAVPVQRITAAVDDLTGKLPELRNFLAPGGTESAARLPTWRHPRHHLGAAVLITPFIAGSLLEHNRRVTSPATDIVVTPRLRCGIVLRSEEDTCQVLDGGKISSVRYAPQFPAPRRERVLPGHLVAIAEAPDAAAAVVWRWYDAVVLGSDAGSVQLWEPAHGEVTAQRRRPQQQYGPGTRAYLSAGLPDADWWVAGRAVNRAEDAEVELDEVERLYTEHGMWNSVFG
jgi:hypothetical protein